MKNAITILAIIGMVISLGTAFAATPLDAVQNAGTIARGTISLENLNPTVFNDESMNATLGNTSGLIDMQNIDTDLMWRETVDQLNTTV